MTEHVEDVAKKHFLQCPFCPCMFLTRVDLEKHLACMGDHKDAHLECYKRTHGRIEHGYGSE